MAKLLWPDHSREFLRDLANGDVGTNAQAGVFAENPATLPSLKAVDAAIQASAEEWLQDSEYAYGPMPYFSYLSRRWFEIEEGVLDRLLEQFG